MVNTLPILNWLRPVQAAWMHAPTDSRAVPKINPHWCLYLEAVLSQFFPQAKQEALEEGVPSIRQRAREKYTEYMQAFLPPSRAEVGNYRNNQYNNYSLRDNNRILVLGRYQKEQRSAFPLIFRTGVPTVQEADASGRVFALPTDHAANTSGVFEKRGFIRPLGTPWVAPSVCQEEGRFRALNIFPRLIYDLVTISCEVKRAWTFPRHAIPTRYVIMNSGYAFWSINAPAVFSHTRESECLCLTTTDSPLSTIRKANGWADALSRKSGMILIKQLRRMNPEKSRAIIQNIDQQTEFRVDDDGILWQGTKLCVPEDPTLGKCPCSSFGLGSGPVQRILDGPRDDEVTKEKSSVARKSLRKLILSEELPDNIADALEFQPGEQFP
ncbi:hypothetical protein Tco_1503894 [Tanacetum coccineum]